MPRLDDEDLALEQAKGAVDSAFPDLRCLRCGNDAFTLRLLTNSAFLNAHRHVELTCERCGKIETYDLSFLDQAAKPILTEAVDG